MALIKRKEEVLHHFDPLEEASTVMSFATQDQARHYVNKMIKGEFPPEAIAVRSSDLFILDVVTGPINYAKSAWLGFREGLIYALSFGAVMAYLNGFSFGLVEMVVYFGLGIGSITMIFKVSGDWLGSRKKNFESEQIYVANKYEVIVHPALEDQAQEAFLKGALG